MVIAAVFTLMAALSAAGEEPKPRGIEAAKSAEAELGIARTGNFERADPRVHAFYRCYFTGPLELPSSYNKLQLREGTRDGCSLDPGKFDIFFYPIESVASGHAPVTQSLAESTEARQAMVVPHEDFHAAVSRLPDRIGEAAATLAGFLAAEVAARNAGRPAAAASDAALFLRKSVLINRYFETLSDVYRQVRRKSISRPEGFARKHGLFEALSKECAAIEPAPQSFNRCIAVPNNAGLAFDYTYTAYYPLVYELFEACDRDAKRTIQAIATAPRTHSEAAVAAYFREFIRSRGRRP
jgi:hypothetical protein